ncbi:MAG: 50S ribosomal protein L31 [Phototrophicaceae bacterium]|jgi:large subunit ribosomal protein L31
MKKDIHPKWFPKAEIVCASCGTTWQTGATVPSIRTDICSSCHPFYTGEQRIVDTEGRVDKFMKRLREHDNISTSKVARDAAKTPLDLPLEELGLNKRTVTLLQENGMAVVEDFLTRLGEGEAGLLAIPGIGRQSLVEIKKALRQAGYDVPVAVAAE